MRRHRSPGLQLSFVSRGKVDFCVENDKFQLRPGDLVVTRPQKYQSMGNTRACQIYWIILDVGTGRPNPAAWRWPEWFVFSENDLETMTALLCKGTQPVWQAGLDIGDCFKKMHQDLHIKSHASRETHLKLHINELFVKFHDIQQLAEPSRQIDRSTAQQAVDIFLADLPNQLHMEWTLDLMAEKCGLKRSRFNEYCHRMTNRAPMEHLTDCRMQKAMEMLQDENKKSIAEIAAACGYHSPQYFATIFKREVGMKPTRFRTFHKKDKEM